MINRKSFKNVITCNIIFLFMGRGVLANEDSTVWDNIKSPITTDAFDALLIGSGVTLTLLVFEDQIVDPLQEESVEHRPIGQLSPIGDYGGQMIPNALYIAGMYFWGSEKNARGMVESTGYSVLATTLLKYTIREPRPNNSNRRNSFPSGHATSAFAFASYIGCVHGWAWGLGAYSLAGLVALSRINDNAHYLHDVTGGATIGTSFGLGVCLNQKKAGLISKAQILPIGDGAFVQAGWKF